MMSTDRDQDRVTRRKGNTSRKIALEEHFIFPEFVRYFGDIGQNARPADMARIAAPLSDFGERRLAAMDAGGIDIAVLSISGPGVHAEPDVDTAVMLASVANDKLAAEISKQPDRFSGFAHLPMQDPSAAADELERAVRDLGFPGAMTHGQTGGVYLDDPRYEVFWERAESLGAPVYLHPGNPADRPAMYADHPELWGATWSWAVDTCTHALRLIFSGLFDRYPGVQVILGHMGETLPIQLWRLDSRYPSSNHKHKIEKLPSEYIRTNVSMTTSGVFSDTALRCALDAVGVDNIVFATDYPFEETSVACAWIDNAAISDAERSKVCFDNANKLLKLAR